MIFKKKFIKRKCMVSGCKNIGSYSITRRNAFGNSIHICEECARQLTKELDSEKESLTGDGTANFICRECEKEFKTERGLKRHMTEVHTHA